MPKIKKLPPHLIAQIAAGEVIERPVYVVKELVENAIDAHATHITIQVEQGGMKKIVVSDNGDGMDRDDLLQSFLHHTTSKIYDDIEGVKTFGFRGEALSSIAAVADITIQSKTQDVIEGTQVIVEKGEVSTVSPIGMPAGTMISVKNIFQYFPARKKFLKSERTEFARIVDTVSQFVIIYPHIRFVLLHNKKTIFDLYPVKKSEERIKTILGEQIYTHMLPVINSSEYFEISGFIARPQLSTQSNTKQYIYINDRSVGDKVVSTAVKNAYGNLLETNRYPVFVLSLGIPYELVDVNVHPRKEQVNFVNKDHVYESVHATITKTLKEYDLTFTRNNPVSARRGSTHTDSARILREAVRPWNIKSPTDISVTTILQLHETYIVAASNDGITLIDQHAAHERILYEQFRTEFLKIRETGVSYPLPKSVIIELPVSDAVRMGDVLDIFKKLGFEMDSFSGNSYKITAVPEIFKDRDIVLLLHELLEHEDLGTMRTLDVISDTMITFLACRSAVKAGDVLSQNEAKNIIKRLQETPNNTTCPHGRPTKITFPLSELHKMFKRA
jgi:DNA mismatch repair protein MutL